MIFIYIVSFTYNMKVSNSIFKYPLRTFIILIILNTSFTDFKYFIFISSKTFYILERIQLISTFKPTLFIILSLILLISLFSIIKFSYRNEKVLRPFIYEKIISTKNIQN